VIAAMSENVPVSEMRHITGEPLTAISPGPDGIVL